MYHRSDYALSRSVVLPSRIWTGLRSIKILTISANANVNHVHERDIRHWLSSDNPRFDIFGKCNSRIPCPGPGRTQYSFQPNFRTREKHHPHFLLGSNISRRRSSPTRSVARRPERALEPTFQRSRALSKSLWASSFNLLSRALS